MYLPKYSSRALVILLLFLIIATLFPPYKWGEERIKSETERSELLDYLPIKEHNFLFSESKKTFLIVWGWDYEKKTSIPINMVLHREIAASILIMEYVVLFLLFLLINVIMSMLYKQRGSQSRSSN